MDKMKIQFRLNDRVFAVEVDNNIVEHDEIINEAINQLKTDIERNNETIENIFFECLEVVCSDCGVTLNLDEEQEDFKCVSCNNS